MRRERPPQIESACMRKKPCVPHRRIGTFGFFGGGNYGNDGSLEAALVFLRQTQPDSELWCICARPEVVAQDHGIATLPIRTPAPSDTFGHGPGRLLWKAVREVFDFPATLVRVLKFGVIIVPGTGILDDFGERPWLTPLSILRLCVISWLVGTEVWFVSIGAGPVHHPLSRLFILWAAQLAHYRSYRDALSRDYMTSIGLDTGKDQVYPDLAFGLSAPQRSSTGSNSGEAQQTIGVGVMAYYGWKPRKNGPEIYDTYINRMTCFVLWLLDQNYRVRLITGQEFG